MFRKLVWVFLLVMLIGVSVFAFPNRTTARWIARDDIFYINPIKVCQDGIHFGVAAYVGDPPAETLSLNVTARLEATGEQLWDRSLTLSLRSNPIEGFDYIDYFDQHWYENNTQLLPGTKVILGGGELQEPTVLVGDCSIAPPEPSGIAYQGYLSDGNSAANGLFDLRFTLYNAASGGSQVTDPMILNDVAVEDGYFTVELDFGADQFSATNRWLQIGVRPGGSSGSFTDLTPRQAVGAVPFALNVLNTPTHNHVGETWYSNYQPLKILGSDDLDAPLVISNTLGTAVRIGEALDGSGLQVDSAAYDGIFVRSANDDGIEIDSAAYGLFAPGVQNIALLVETSVANGEWALYTNDNIRAANVVLNSATLIARLDTDQSINPGDLAAAAGVSDPLPGSRTPLPLVALADSQSSSGVVGVVESRMQFEPAPGKQNELGGAPMVLHSAPGEAQAGDLVAITISGMARVRVDPGTAGVIPGAHLVVGVDGLLRPQKTTEVNGIQMVESASDLGIALSVPDEQGWMWMLVNSR